MSKKKLEEKTTLTKTLIKGAKLSLLKELIQNPDRKTSIRSLSKKTGISYVTTREFVSKLLILGFLKEERKANARFISVNKKSPYYKKIKEIIEIDTKPLKEIAEKYSREVTKKVEEVKKIILYGSVVRGDPTLTSDIDILILVQKKTGKAESIADKIADKYQRNKGVKISPLVEEVEEYETGLREEDPFYQKVESSKKVLYED